MNPLFYVDNLSVLRERVPDESEGWQKPGQAALLGEDSGSARGREGG
jgi:hypothetical protein